MPFRCNSLCRSAPAGKLHTCHCIKSQDEEGHEDSLCCEQADGEGEDEADVVVGHRDHLNLETGKR